MSYTNGLDKPTDYFNTVLYTGDASSSQAQTGIGHQPDMVWLKSRNTTDGHFIIDSVRGATKAIRPYGTNAEVTDTAGLLSFDTDGFTVGSSGPYGASGQNYVAWNWKASGSTASNTDGTITSTVSANQTAGFSIGTYNGTSADNTVGHGLSQKPDMIIVKCKSTAHDWGVYHSSLGSGKVLTLNATTAAQSATGWQNTDPTSTVFSIDNAANSFNQSGQSFVFYAFASKKGYSKCGSYVANGDASGGFVYTGFKIGWLMIKRTDSAAGWIIYDSKREGRNTENDYLLASSSSAEGTNNEIDLLSNGFKPREANRNELNVSGASYVYLAFAESPFVTSSGIPTTAR